MKTMPKTLCEIFRDEAEEDRKRLIDGTKGQIEILRDGILQAINWIDMGAPGVAREKLLELLKK